jgi:hypothetical protein
MTKRSTSVSHEDDWIIHVLVILSILIEILIDALRCLTSNSSASPTPPLGKQDLPSKDIKSTKSGSTKTQPLSPSTKRRSTTAVQRKVDGGTTQDILSSPIASSPRGKRSKPSSNTSTSTKSQSSQASASRRRTRTTKSTSPMNLLSSTPHLNHTTADDTHSCTTDWAEHQPTESVRILPEPQEEAQEHTVLRTKVSRSKLKA